MKFAIYEMRRDEVAIFRDLAAKYKVDLVEIEDMLDENSISLAQNCQGIGILGQSILNDVVLEQLRKEGIQNIITRTVGYNHIDLEYAKKLGMKIGNAFYDPNGVADFTIMLMLLCIRNYKPALWRGQVNDYSLDGLLGREMRNLTVGILGTGRIGQQVIENLIGFGCKILAYNIPEIHEVKKHVKYVSLDELYRNCDMISVHLPLTEKTHHMIDKNAIDRMKDGVILINAARGELMDIQALIDGIENRKIGSLGLDVVENEAEIYHRDRKTDIIQNKEMAYLRQFPNVVMTQHMAFYTDASVLSMAKYTIEGLVSFCNNEYYQGQLT